MVNQPNDSLGWRPNTSMPAECGELVISMKTFRILLFTQLTLSLATAGAATEQEIS